MRENKVIDPEQRKKAATIMVNKPKILVTTDEVFIALTTTLVAILSAGRAFKIL